MIANGELFCYECDYKCKQKDQLKHHKEAKHDAIFVTLNLLLNLQSKSTKTQSTMDCQLCSHKATTKLSLKRHIKIQHDEIYSCNKCEYKTGNKPSFTEHLRKHCNLCSYKSKGEQTMKKHISSLHIVQTTEENFQITSQLPSTNEEPNKNHQTQGQNETTLLCPVDDCIFTIKTLPANIDGHLKLKHGIENAWEYKFLKL